jgi:cytochrome c-type biogenesis protein CcmH/NrfG
MTDAPEIVPAAPGGKFVLFCIGLCLLAIFVSSVVYRLQNPGLTVPGQAMPAAGQGGAGGMPGMGDMGDMAAVRELMKTLQDHPGDPETLLKLARAFAQMQAWAQAKVFLDDLLSREPDNEQGLTLAGVVAYQQEDYPAAAAVYEKILVASPDNVMARFNLGILYKHYLGRPEEARKLFEGLLALKPDDARLAEMVKKELETPAAAAPAGQ